MAAIIHQQIATLEAIPQTPPRPPHEWKVVREYEVFARESQLDPFQAVGSVLAPNDKLAKAYARAAYDEGRWVELTIAPLAEDSLRASRKDAA